MPSFADIAKLMSKYKDIQGGMKQLKEELPGMEFSSSGSKNLVTVTVGGDFSIRKIELAPGSTVDRFELALELQNATNMALNSAKAAIQERMKELTGGIDLPGMF